MDAYIPCADRFVWQRSDAAAVEEKKLKEKKLIKGPDYQYFLYAVEHKSTQEYAAGNLGKGGGSV